MDVIVMKTYLLNIAVLVTCPIILAGCNTFQKPSSSYSLQRFAVPEVASEAWKLSAHAGYAKIHKVVLPTTEAGMPNFDCKTNNSCVEDDHLFVAGDVSVAEGLAFTFNSQLNRISTTWQFYGENQGKAQAGNISQALVLGYSRHSDNSSTIGDINNFNPAEWSQKTQTVDLGWVGGYRIDEQWLIYGGPFVSIHDIDNTVDTTTRTANEVIKTYNQFNFSGRQQGANIAVQYQTFSWLEVQLEWVFARYQMNNASVNDSQLNLMVGTRF